MLVLLQGATPHAPPVHDVNAPDLYLPVMSFITFVLLTGLIRGTRMQFTPAVLSDVTNACLVTQILEVAVIKLGLHLLSSATVPLLDLVAYTGYKYIGLVFNSLVGMLLGGTAYYVALVYTGCAAVFFMANTLSHVMEESDSHLSAPSKRNYLLLGTSGLQFLLMWWLGNSA